MKYIFFILMAVIISGNVFAIPVSDSSVVATIVGEDMEKIQTIATLEDDIITLKSELAQCQKSKKGWIAATVVGSAGVVATGVAAGVQGAQIADKKDQLEQLTGSGNK
mgnify:CR=1 FL=1